ncbi:hypothetical protein C8R43DRAFT_1041897 [Mycena crocata]|nr:hypothetical protein C8R43DRAFT_1041897 [Mycena crocata]
MSLFVEGIHVTAVSYTSNPRTLLSRRLFDSLQLPTGRPVLLTTAVPGYPSPSTSLRVVSTHGNSSVPLPIPYLLLFFSSPPLYCGADLYSTVNLRKYSLLHPPLFRRQARLLRPIPLSTAPLELFSTALLDALLLLPMERNCLHLPHRMLRQVGLSSGRLMFPPWARLSTPYPCGPNYLRGLHLRGLKMLLCLYLNSIIAHP